MANYHFEVTIISRGKGRSVTAAVGYISGKTLRDNYSSKTYYNSRNDVIWQKIFLPNDAPQEFRNLQYLCNEIECAEVRRDARTARQFIGSLPNELPPGSWFESFMNLLRTISCPVACVRSPLSIGAATVMTHQGTTLMSISLFPPGQLAKEASVNGRIGSMIRGSTSPFGGSSGRKCKIEPTSGTDWTSRSAMRHLKSKESVTVSRPST